MDGILLAMVYTGQPYRNYQREQGYLDLGRRKYISGKKPRHTPESRKEATRRERIRVKALAQAYLLLQRVIPFDSGTKITYLTVLRGAMAYIKALEMILGIRKDIFTPNGKMQEKSGQDGGESFPKTELLSIKEEPS